MIMLYDNSQGVIEVGIIDRFETYKNTTGERKAVVLEKLYKWSSVSGRLDVYNSRVRYTDLKGFKITDKSISDLLSKEDAMISFVGGDIPIKSANDLFTKVFAEEILRGDHV